MFCVKSESWDMWPVCEVTCKIQINSDNSLSSVTQHSCQSRNLLSRPENDIHTPGMVRPCWYFCSGLSGKCHGPLNIARGSHDSSDPAAHSFRWRWPDKVLIMPSHMRYHSRQGQWSPCIKGFELELSFLVGRLERIFFQREMPLTCDEKQRNTFRLIDGHMLWNSRMFLHANDDGWWWLSVCIQQVQLYTGLWRCKWASKNISFPQNTWEVRTDLGFFGYLFYLVVRSGFECGWTVINLLQNFSF